MKCTVHLFGDWTRQVLVLIPVYMRFCSCGEWEIRFPPENEVPRKEMLNSFEASQIYLKRLMKKPRPEDQ
jgi:hypothetical protein